MRIEADSAHPKILRENTSVTNAVYTKPFPGARVGNISHLPPIGARSLKLTIHQVRAKNRAFGFARRDRCPTFGLAGQSNTAHQPGCLLASNVNALALQHAPHLPHPVDAVVFSVNLAEMLYKGSVAKHAGA